MGKKGRVQETNRRRIVRLDDLAPRSDIVGGTGRIVFGEGVMGERAARDRAVRMDRGRGPGARSRD